MGRAHPLEELFSSAVGEAELRYGAVAILSGGWRREALLLDIERMLRHGFEDRVLPFEREAGRVYAELATMCRLFAPADCQIAAIAPARGMTVATRNIRDFEGKGIEVVDPRAAA